MLINALQELFSRYQYLAYEHITENLAYQDEDEYLLSIPIYVDGTPEENATAEKERRRKANFSLPRRRAARLKEWHQKIKESYIPSNLCGGALVCIICGHTVMNHRADNFACYKPPMVAPLQTTPEFMAPPTGGTYSMTL